MFYGDTICQNYYLRFTNKPHCMYVPTQYPENHVIGPFLINRSLNGNCYLALIRNNVLRMSTLENYPD